MQNIKKFLHFISYFVIFIFNLSQRYHVWLETVDWSLNFCILHRSVLVFAGGIEHTIKDCVGKSTITVRSGRCPKHRGKLDTEDKATQTSLLRSGFHRLTLGHSSYPVSSNIISSFLQVPNHLTRNILDTQLNISFLALGSSKILRRTLRIRNNLTQRREPGRSSPTTRPSCLEKRKRVRKI